MIFVLVVLVVILYYFHKPITAWLTSLIKRQWGENMKKFGGIQLPGGVLLNGQQVYDEAVDEIKQIENEMQLKSELPVDFYTG